MKKLSSTPAWQTAIVVLACAVVGMLALAWLYWAQAVCIPVALAIFLTFVLSPLVTALQRRGMGRVLSVLLPVAVVAFILAAVVWIVGAQAKNMADEAPKYAENIRARIRSLRSLGQDPMTKRLETMARDIADEFDRPAARPRNDGAGGDGGAESLQVLVEPATPSWLSFLPALLGRLAEALGGLALAFVLLVFMLLNREDMRNRLIRLLGHGRLTTTTKVIDDASHRISRYLQMQLVVNGVFGLVLSAGLLTIGLPYALLWGFLTFVLRYIPYVGVWVAAVPPVLLSLAVFAGWARPLMVFGIFLVMELVAGNVIEPRLYGRSVGVSEVAFLIAAAFGAFLWGPIGIVLSSPLIVCLVVMGKYIPFLSFLDILLGDGPALTADIVYYQRLLARNREEAREIVAARTKESSLQHAFDEILVPALTYFKRDRKQLTDANAEFVLEAAAESLEPAVPAIPSAGADDGVATPAAEGPMVHVLACPAQDEADLLALTMLSRLLAPAKWKVEILPVGTLASELVAHVARSRPGVVCIGAVAPDGLRRTRYLCSRLRARFPEIKLVVGRWGLKRGVKADRDRLRKVGVHFVAATISETRSQLRSLFPALVWQQSQGNVNAGGAREVRQQTLP
jgi:predicted PurR-regulated permease PerM